NVTESISTSFLTGYAAGVTNVQGGDTVYYLLSITNSGTALGTTAYDLWLSNSLPAGLTSPYVIAVTNLALGAIYTNGVLVGNNTIATNLFSTAGNILSVAGTNEIDLDTNANLVIVVAAQISYGVNPLQIITNYPATIEWSSLPGVQTNLSAYNANGNARTGVSNPLPAVNVNNSTNEALLDNYAAASGVTAEVVAGLNFAKQFVATSQTASGNFATNLAIGELASYTLTLLVPQGVTTNVTIVDTLPAGMAFVSVTGAVTSNNVTCSQPITPGTTPANSVIPTNGTSVTFNLGNVTNLNNNDLPAGVAITFNAVALNVLANQAGLMLTNSAQFTSGGISTNVTATPVQVVEPTLQVSELISSDNLHFFAATNNLEASNTVYLQITITNSAGVLGTTAYDLWLSNSLPANLMNPAVLSVTTLGAGTIYTNGVSVGNGVITNLFAFNGNLLTVAGANTIDVETNGALVLLVAAQLNYGVAPQQVLTNLTTIEWSSLPGTQTNLSSYNTNGYERIGISAPLPGVGVNNSTNGTLLNNYAAASGVTAATVRAPSFAKQFVATSQTASGNFATNLAIGELASYTLTLLVPQGVTTNVTIVDTLPAGMAFVSVTGAVTSNNVTCSQPITPGTTPANSVIPTNGTSVTFNLGNVTNLNNNDLPAGVAITFNAVALNVLANQAGLMLTNSAQFTSGGISTNVTATPVQVVEPTLQVSELISSDNLHFFAATNNLEASNTVYLQITITNSAGVLGTTAYDLWLSNSLPANLMNPAVLSVTTLGAGTIYTNGVSVGNGVITNLFAFNGNLLTVAGANTIDVETNGALVLLVAAQLNYGVAPQQVLTNLTTIEWSSLPGTQTNLSSYNTNGYERIGISAPLPGVGVNNSTNGTLLNNYAAASGVTAATVRAPSFAKTLVNSGSATNQPIGGYAAYTLTVTVPQGVTTNASIVDTVQGALAFVDVTNVAWSPGITNSQPVTVATNPANTLVSGNGQSVTFNLGNITNLNNNGAAASLAITFRMVALDVQTNQAGSNLLNSATFTSGAFSTNVTAAAVQTIEPRLSVTNAISLSPTSGFGTALTSLQASNTVYYQIIITNSGGPLASTAFDLWLSNSLPAGIMNPVIYSVTNYGTGSVFTNGVSAATGYLSNSLFTITGNNVVNVGASRIDLATNAMIGVVVSAQLNYSVFPQQSFTNNTTIEWTSLSGVQTNLSVYNATANERIGLSSPLPAPGINNSTNENTILDNYAAAATNLIFTVVAPNIVKTIVQTSETNTIQNQIISQLAATPDATADFNATTFTGYSPAADFTGGANTWSGATVTTAAQFIRMSGTGTGRGGAYLSYSNSVINLSGYASMGVVARGLTGNASALWIRLVDADGTIWRYTIGSPTIGVNFAQSTVSLLTPNSVDAAGSTPGLDFANIVRIDIRGDNTAGLFKVDIDSIMAIRTLAVPGEIIRYRITAQVPEGASPDLIIKDTLPTGMRFLNDNTARIAFISPNTNITSYANGLTSPKDVPAISMSGSNVVGSADTVSSFNLSTNGGSGVALADKNISSAAASNADTYNSASAVFFRLGNVTNTANDTVGEYIVIEFNALVDNITNNQAGVVLANTAGYFLNGNNANTQVGSSTANNDFNNLVIVEPQINNLSKVIVGTPQHAGDVYTNRIRFSNDVKPAEQSAPTVAAATTADLGATFLPTSGVGGVGRFTSAPTTVDGVVLHVGDRLLVKDQTTASQNGVYRVVAAGVWDRAQDFNSTANINLGYRVYVNGGTVNGNQLFAEKTAGPFSVNSTAIIFTNVAVNSSVRLAASGNVAGSLVGNVYTATGLTSGKLSIDGFIAATNDRILFRGFTTSQNNGIYTLISTNATTATLLRSSDMDQTAEAIQGYQVYVTAGVTNGNKIFALAGSVAALNTTAQTWNPVDQATAYNVVMNDTLPANALFQSITITTPDSGGPQTYTTTGANTTWGTVVIPAVGSSGTVTVTLYKLDPETKISGATKDVSIDISTALANPVQVGSDTINTATLRYASLPYGTNAPGNATGSWSPGVSGTVTGARNGSSANFVNPTDDTYYNLQALTPGNTNNYVAGATSIFSFTNQPWLDKQFMNGGTNGDYTSVASSPGTNVVIGEKVTYDILVNLPEGVTKGLNIIDTLPSGLRLDTVQVVTNAGSGLNASTLLGANFNGYTSNSSISPALPITGPATITLGFGDTTNLADVAVNDNAFVVRLTATVLDIAGNVSGATAANTATLTYTNQSYTNTVTDANPANDPTIKVMEPALTLTKTVPATQFDAGDLVTYTLNIANNSQQMAYDLSVTDALPAMLTGGYVLGGGNFVASGFYASTVRAASTNDLGASFSAGNFSGAPATLDGIALSDNDRVLVKNQASPAQNGIYTVSSASGGTWTRASDFNNAAQITNGYLVSVLAGIWNTNALYRQTNAVVSLNTDPINWIYFGTNTLPQASNFAVVSGVVQVNGSGSVNLPPGASLSLKVGGTMVSTYQAGQVITNTATIQWSSTPGANSDERTGSGSPAYNNYTATNTAITMAAAPVLSKTIIATDEPGVVGNSGITGTNATIGELITYRVTVSLPEGTTTNLVLNDSLPLGLAYVTNSLAYLTNHPADANASHPGTGTANFNGTLPALPSVTPAAVTNGVINFAFGTITVAGDNDTNNNTFAFTYKAIVLDLATNSGYSSNQRFWTNGITWAAGLTNGTGL
ncbi:MAG: hypothetical protein WCS94_15985, partial [Verrucomicrobiota bacterium]